VYTYFKHPKLNIKTLLIGAGPYGISLHSLPGCDYLSTVITCCKEMLKLSMVAHLNM